MITCHVPAVRIPHRDVPGTTRDAAMANERLRAAILRQGLTLEELAELVQVDAKTVERWVGGQVPYLRAADR